MSGSIVKYLKLINEDSFESEDEKLFAKSAVVKKVPVKNGNAKKAKAGFQFLESSVTCNKTRKN